MDELFSQTKAVYTNSELINKKSRSVSPQRDPRDRRVHEDGYTKKSGRCMDGDQKILDPKIQVDRDLRAGAGVSSATPKRSPSNSKNPISPDERATSCAMRRDAW